MKRIYALSFLLSAIIFTTYSQSMVENIRTTAQARGTAINNGFEFNGAVYFTADDGTNGIELWRSDGTEPGTFMVRDINPGPEGSEPAGFTIHNGELYFSARDETSGRELWKTNGTSSGTVLVADVRTGATSGNPLHFASFNGQLYFSVLYGPILGGTVEGPARQLWRTNGTGAEQVFDLWSNNDDRIENLIVFENQLFFTGRDATQIGLWRLETSGNYFFLVQGPIGDLTISGTSLFFRNGSFNSPNELYKWQSDAPTLLKTFDSFSGYSLSFLTDVNGTLFFSANENGTNGDNELWKSDGTIAGTVLVKDIRPGTSSSQSNNFLAVGNTVFFTATDGTSGIEMWRSDGTDAGTYRVKDISAGSGSANISNMVFVPMPGFPLGGQIFFTASFSADLWITDGTDAGTRLVKDLNPGTQPSSASGLVAFGDKVLFSGNDPLLGKELWLSDGTEPGTVIIKNIVNEDQSAFRDGHYGEIQPAWYSHANGALYFTAYDDVSGIELYKTNVDATGAEIVKELRTGVPGGNPEYSFNINGKITFRGSDGTVGSELWQTDGTEANTTLVEDIRPGGQSSFPLYGASIAGIRYFVANDGTSGNELWRSDGTANGTYMVKDIRPGSSSGEVTNMTVLGNTLFFVANDGVTGYELWKSDGTEAGTVLVKDIRAGAPGVFMQYAENNELVAIGGYLYFRGSATSAQQELWRTDGTDAGTIKLTTEDKDPKYITDAGGKIFFNGTPPGVLVQEELYAYDPVLNTVSRLTNCCPSSETARPGHFVSYNGLLYFNGYTPEFGWELGVSDGGSVSWIDIIPGKESSNPQNLTVYLGRLYFSGASREHGVELWQSDGSPAGTEIVSDIWPGAQGSNPQQFIRANGDLYFLANDGVADYELWRFNPTVQYSLPAGNTADSITIQWSNIVTTGESNELLATIRQAGAQPLNDKVKVRVTIDPSIQQYNGVPYVQRHYDIEPQVNAASATANVTLYFTQQEFDDYNLANGILGDLPVDPSDVNALPLMRIIQYHGEGTTPGNYPGSTVVIDPDDSNIRWNSDGFWEVEFDVTGFSGFYLTTIEATALPVRLVSFTASHQAGMVQLIWNVEEQDGIVHYVVERSSDAAVFYPIDTVIANSFSSYSYQSLDAVPIMGANYYRLKVRDQDGSLDYSNVIRIDLSMPISISLFPNPVSSVFRIKLGSSQLLNSNANLYDSHGRLVRSIRLTSLQQAVDVSTLPSGVYYLRVNNIFTISLIKN